MKIAWLLIASLFLITNPAIASDSDQTATFDVDKMSCSTCPIAVRKAMQRVDGVKEVSVDLDSRTAIVTYDASVTTVKEIGSASTDVGFPATVRDRE